jgi:uncharacterized SAM-binding protein YcdF (DUF218 family)
VARVFFVLSKTLDLLVAPLTWALLLIIGAAWCTHRGQRARALWMLVAAAAVLFTFSEAPVARAIVRSLEASAVSTTSGDRTYDVVVVLGGMVGGGSTPQAPEFGEAVDRIIAGYDVVRHDRAKYILVTSDALEAPAMATQLGLWGTAADRIVVEDRSRNTRENAIESAKIIKARGWTRILLVTSALHMPRASGCFRAVGLTFDTLVVDHLAPPPDAPEPVGPRADALDLSTQAIRETVGRAVYWVAGYSR